MRLDPQDIFFELRQMAVEFSADVFALAGQLEPYLDVGLVARQFLIRGQGFFQPFARLEDFLGVCRIVVEAGLGDLLL